MRNSTVLARLVASQKICAKKMTITIARTKIRLVTTRQERAMSCGIPCNHGERVCLTRLKRADPPWLISFLPGRTRRSSRPAFFLMSSASWSSLAVWYYFTPKYSRVGYQPVQPVHFQHDIHVGQLGLDCRYCHSYVEVSGHSNFPTTQTCMNCHRQVQKDEPEAPADPRFVGQRHAGCLGEDPQRARLRLLQSLRARESRRQLRELPRAGRRR